MYSNSNHNMKYSFILHSNGLYDMLITIEEHDTPEYLTVQNNEFNGKQYIVMLGDRCIYHDTISINKNLLSVENMSLHDDDHNPIWILIKNVNRRITPMFNRDNKINVDNDGEYANRSNVNSSIVNRSFVNPGSGML